MVIMAAAYISLGLLPLAFACGLARPADVILLLGLTIFRHFEATYYVLKLFDLHLDIRVLRAVVCLPVAVYIAKWLLERRRTSIKSTSGGPVPLFYPSRTTHTRLFPKMHSFSYSYLLVGIPVGWQGSVGGMIPADREAHRITSIFQGNYSDNSWYTVDAGDYLNRGHRQLGLDGKLRKFIESQGLCPEDYPYAYLVTAPRFFGYSFNPVSFWYLYSADRELSAMILEVNNTFDERHMYFLKPSDDSLGAVDHSHMDGIISNGVPTSSKGSAAPVISGLQEKPTRFTNSWAKEFHVSPFNSRKGTYSLVAYDPLFPSMSGRGSVDNTVTLKSSKGHSKLVARIFSERVPVDPHTMSTWQKVRFLISWWWVGLVTYPRIVREAGKLFFMKKLHVWFRPEPQKTSIGRHADATEQVLEASFRRYLRHLVKTAAAPIVVRYTAAGIRDASEEMIVSETEKDNRVGSRTLEVNVLTPVFYSRFVHYAHDLEAFFSEFHESGTIWLSQPSLLPELVLKKPRPPYGTPSLVNYLYFSAIQSLRRRPAPIEGPKTSSAAALQSRAEKKSDIRNFHLSAMDGYILAESTCVEQKKYRTAVLKLFISDRVALGNVDLLRAEIFMLRCLALWVLAGSLGVLWEARSWFQKVPVSTPNS